MAEIVVVLVHADLQPLLLLQSLIFEQLQFVDGRGALIELFRKHSDIIELVHCLV